MSDEQPETTWGREPCARVGNFECPCGNVIIDSTVNDDSVKVDIIETDRPPVRERVIACSNCGRDWWLESERPVWVTDNDSWR